MAVPAVCWTDDLALWDLEVLFFGEDAGAEPEVDKDDGIFLGFREGDTVALDVDEEAFFVRDDDGDAFDVV